MAKRVLVAYASKYGATAQIAERIGEVLRGAGLDADVQPANRVKDLSPYAAVVLGSAVYAGSWLKSAADFLRSNEQALAERSVWLFSSGPTGEGDPVELLKGWRIPQALQPVADRIGPRDVTVFHGAIDMSKLSFPERLLVRGIKAAVGDFRDWDTIAAWATGIAGAIAKDS